MEYNKFELKIEVGTPGTKLTRVRSPLGLPIPSGLFLGGDNQQRSHVFRSTNPPSLFA